MSQRAFIVKLEVTDNVDPSIITEDITDLLLSEGYQVIEVNVWKSQNETINLASSLGLGDPAQADEAPSLGVPGIGL